MKAVPINYFAIPFGIAGLAGAWDAAAALGAPEGVGRALWWTAAVVWTAFVVPWSIGAVRSRGATVADVARHPVLGPFVALVPVIALMATARLVPVPAVALAVVSALLAVLGASSAWTVARWLSGGLRLEQVHPGYMLPVVAAPLIAAGVLGRLGATGPGYALVGVGLLFWAVVLALVLARSATSGPVVGALTPTLAILAAPPAVAGTALLRLGADAVVLDVLLGLTVWGALMQMTLIPRFARVPFAPTFWSFTFSYAAVVAFVLQWTVVRAPAVAPWVGWPLLAAISALVVAIAGRMLVGALLERRQVREVTASAEPVVEPVR